MHATLPGHGAHGPALEIYSYDDMLDMPVPVANQTGYGHLAFEVADVPAALRSVVAHGGSDLGSVAKATSSSCKPGALRRNPAARHRRSRRHARSAAAAFGLIRGYAISGRTGLGP